MRRAERLPLALNMQDVVEFYLMTQLICTLLLFSKTGPVKKWLLVVGPAPLEVSYLYNFLPPFQFLRLHVTFLTFSFSCAV